MPRDTAGLGSSPFARRYWGNRYYFLLLRVLRCFSSPRSPHASRDVGIAPDGLPHSDIRRSMGICPSLRLFAACHVLLRLREPRHPPCALVSVPLFFFSTSASRAEVAFFITAYDFRLVFLPCVTARRLGLIASTAGALVALLFVSRFLAGISIYDSYSMPRFHHVSVLFPRWRITESNR